MIRMFSVENFYLILHQQLLNPVGIRDMMYVPFGSIEYKDIIFGRYMPNTQATYGKPFNAVPTCYFFDQEPVNENSINQCQITHTSQAFKILATSEHSVLKNKIIKSNEYYDWYYFFHGFAALDWFRDAQYLSHTTSWEYPYICMNRLFLNDRSYRLNLTARLIDNDLINKGLVSLNFEANSSSWQNELNDPNCRLSSESKELINKTLGSVKSSLKIDKKDVDSSASANLGDEEFTLWQRGLWHVVTETVFYHKKQHLTEKIFKPIVSKRPFILVAAPGNLAYLKSYGFKTFDQWIDESYDNIEDPDLRLKAITEQLKKLCSMSKEDLEIMYAEMTEILDFNFNHFWSTFKEKIVNELVDNFELCVRLWNTSRVDWKSLPIQNIDFVGVKKILLK